MTKSSSSSKILKPSRDSSKLLRSVKKKKKKKTKRNKSKKIKEYSDKSESNGSDSSLYSSSEDDYRRKRRRSKVSKKRSRKRYTSSESDDSGDDRLLKKKKRSKRKNERVGKKKKISSRKRRKGDLSSSSTSSESGSFRSDDGSESDGKRRTRDRGRLGEVKAVRRRSEDELEKGNEPDGCWQVEDEVMTQKNSRRLKSIVVVSYTYDNDHRKEDMLDDHDDESDEDKFVDDERDRGARHSYPKTVADEYGRKTVDYDELEEDAESETSKSCHPDNSLKDDDLEAILKKRALENLKRFRGEIQRSGIPSKEVFSVSSGQPLRIESEIVEESRNLETSRKVLQDANVKEFGTVLPEFTSQQDQQPGETAKVKTNSGISSCTTKRKLIRPVMGQESRKDAEAESMNGSTIDQNCPESSLDMAPKNGSETIEPTQALSTLRAQSFSHADTVKLDKIKEGSQSQQRTMDETRDESQYEQKTMTVMRGGEMVQVSYKVYIPKKTSSLGRRQLER